MKIRDAALSDAAQICTVFRRSIAELCIADHHNDPAILAQWLSNKTPANVATWIVQSGSSMLVAIDEEDEIVGVGSITDLGEILLNYVSPNARFRGVSRALLKALEARAAERGNARCTLTSTATARRFYASAGYREGAPGLGAGPGYRMSKDLSSENSN